jgi:hypothetical protein
MKREMVFSYKTLATTLKIHSVITQKTTIKTAVYGHIYKYPPSNPVLST